MNVFSAFLLHKKGLMFRKAALFGIFVLLLTILVNGSANEMVESKKPQSEESLYFVFLKYIKSLDEVDRLVPPHVDFLKQCYEEDAFIFSGPQQPRVGGLILSKNDSLEAVWAQLKRDPFYENEIADITVIEFIPRLYDDRFACFAKKEINTSKQILIDHEKTMFVIDLHYIVPLEQVDALLPQHREYLLEGYQRREFICSGPKQPRTGGIILANARSLEELWTVIKTDPFYIHQAAEFTVTEFKPWMHDVRFSCFMTEQ